MPLLDWAARYRAGDTPWDLGGPHPELVALFEGSGSGLGHFVAPSRAYVPGCGRGHDAIALARNGWSVTAIDVVQDLQTAFPQDFHRSGGRFAVADALQWSDVPFDLLWEHTFFCALPPDQRPHYGRMARRLVKPGGWLLSVVFPVGKQDGAGPPWDMSAAALAEALGTSFRLVEDRPAEHPGAWRPWAERWAGFQRV